MPQQAIQAQSSEFSLASSFRDVVASIAGIGDGSNPVTDLIAHTLTGFVGLHRLGFAKAAAPATTEVAYESYHGTIVGKLSTVKQIQAIYASVDDAGTVHVYSIAPEFSDRLYNELLKQEREVEKKFPGVSFEFHVRARQNRALALVAPFGSQPIYVR
jgi:hypothetical protein